jgi:hypothetical protein
MPPFDLLILLIAVTIGAVLIDRWRHGRERGAYRRLAAEYRMHYSPGDPLRLTPRVAAQLPVPGAAGVRVIDLLYRTDDENHYYIFTAEYTLGVVGPKHRIRRGAALIESKTLGEMTKPVRLAPVELPLIEQYRNLIQP